MFDISQGAIVGSIVSYAFMVWLGIGKYTVIGSPETLQFPTSTCNIAKNYSMMPYTYDVTSPDFYAATATSADSRDAELVTL